MGVSLLFGKRTPHTKIGHIELDVTLSEQHAYTSSITQYPIEDGAFISDHRKVEPESISLEGLITDTPIGGRLSSDRSHEAFNDLVRLFKSQELVTVVTGLKVYDDMAITSLHVPKNSTTGQALKFSIKLVKVRMGSPSFSSEILSDLIADQAKSKVNLGRQLLEEAKEEWIGLAKRRLKFL